MIDFGKKVVYRKTPIYRGVWGKETSAVNRGFVWFTLCIFSPIWGEGNGRGISGFAVNRGAVNRGFTVLTKKNYIERPYFQSSDSASSEKAGLDDLPSRGKLNFRKNRFRGKLAFIST